MVFTVRWAALASILVGLLLLTIYEMQFLPDGKLHLHVFDVGQGDGMLMTTPTGKHIVIDGGPNQSLLELLGKHMSFFDRTIELVILSHPDADHVTALPELLKRYRVKYILMTGALHGSGRYDALLSAIAGQQTAVLLPDPQYDIDLGDGVVLDVIWPSPELFSRAVENPNDESVVVRVLYDQNSILLAGDIETSAEHQILQSGIDISASVLKVPHHGSRTSSSTGFLLAVAPQSAVFSAGKGNAFGHPHTDVIKRYQNLSIPTRSTQSGSLYIMFSGASG